jgi:choline-sulfatase
VERVGRSWRSSVGRLLTPGLALGLGAGLALAALGLLVLLGETGGGRTALSIWGVLRREELDLRLPGYLALVVVLSYQLPAFGSRLGGKGVAGFLLALGLAAGGLLVCADRATNDPVFSANVERNAALAARPLGVARAITDTDRDGFAGRFGGGDCNDRDSAINPAAEDLPSNGVDEDCSGADLTPSVVAAASTGAGEVAPLPTAEAPAVPPDMNVLLVTVDTLRHDLGYMGYERPISPNIDKLAARSTVYERAYALASYTSKSLAPMLIGRYGMETRRGWMHFNRYPPEDVMLQERVRQGGIRALSVQGHWYFDERSGMGRGFDVLDLSASPKVPQAEGDKTVNSRQLTDAAIQHLRAIESKQRFYMWVHYLDPHAEYVKHEEFVFGKNQRALYDGEIAFTDAQIGRLLDTLNELPMAGNTAIVFTSDHGEAFGEHGMVRHGFELWEELVRVPLLVYVPGQTPRRYSVRRSAIDIVPTVLELLKLPVPSGAADDFVRGTSLVSEVVGAPTSAPSARPIFVDMPAGPYNGDRQAFIRGDLKLITSDSKPVGLYDLATDPGERTNLVADKPRTGAALDDMKAFRSTLRPVVVKPK